MTFHLTIDCANAAFEEDLNAAIRRVLETAADAMERGDLSGPCHDENGNTVGQWHFTEE